ncbi:hypothetical protein AMATHDRAFT_7767 [Amanita thiersii Skay4041]|uniref:Transmembrane protein n=1 Tax=Amanita thiersii Skay4041 TaxID=703135 RepID=A0A2A9NFD3_9AGAR|nr:hypothetical protein AMATHDRAFT_7767 [Amanita thiersii Skay4041]
MNNFYIDDSDRNIVYTGVDWGAASGGGPGLEYNSTAHGTSHSGSRFAYTFRGTSISAFGTLGSISSGPVSPNGTFSIDNGETITFQTHPVNSNLYRQMYFQTEDMLDDVHTLVVTITSDIVIFWLDYLMVTPSTHISGRETKIVKIEDDDPKIQYNGNWSTTGSTSYDSKRLVHITNSPGSRASFSFFGTSIAVFGRLPNASTTASYPAVVFTLDDGNPTLLTTLPPIQFNTIYQVPVFQSPALPLGQHTLVIESHDNATEYCLDFIMFSQPANASGPTTSGGSDSNNSNNSNNKSGQASVGPIVGGAVGAGLGFLLFMALAFVLWHKRLSLRTVWKKNVPYAPDELTPFTGGLAALTLNRRDSAGHSRTTSNSVSPYYYPASPEYMSYPNANTKNRMVQGAPTTMTSASSRRLEPITIEPPPYDTHSGTT